ARRHGIDPKMLYRWIRDSKHADWQNTSSEAKAVTSYTPSPGEFRELETENDKLKKLLGEKDLEIAILRDLGVDDWGEVVTRYPYRKVRMDHLLSMEYQSQIVFSPVLRVHDPHFGEMGL
ncbi:transposase, partial [Brevibacillus agri]|uniref:transposase n=1 Tax=Brevibacillus agri TaxID=51101 RepID=UPI002868132F